MLRITLSVVFAAYLLLIVLGYLKPNVSSAESAMWSIGWVGVLALLYSSLNSFNAMRHSINDTTRVVYIGLLFSFLPLLVATYSVAVWQYSPSKLTTYQIISMLFGGLAAIIDLSLFSWLSFGQARRIIKSARSAGA